MAFARLNSGVATRRGFAFAIVKPALKRGPTLDCRYRGKAKPVTGEALNWNHAPTLDCHYCGNAKLATGKAVNWKRGSTLDCRYRGKTCPR